MTIFDALTDVIATLSPGPSIKAIERRSIRSFQHRLEHLFVSREDGSIEEFFLRLYEGSFSWWTLEADLERRETAAFKILEKHGFAIPEFLLRHQNPSMAISRRARGVPVSERFEREAVEATAVLLARMHAVTKNEDSSDLPDLSLPQLFTRLRAWAREAGDFEVLVDRLERSFESTVESRTFVHGDCNGRNFLYADGHLVVLDLEESGVGDPRIDVATMLYNLPRESREVFLRKYEAEAGEVGSLEKWTDLLHVRDIITANVVAKRKAAGLAVPRFNSALWLQYANEIEPALRTRLSR